MGVRLPQQQEERVKLFSFTAVREICQLDALELTCEPVIIIVYK